MSEEFDHLPVIWLKVESVILVQGCWYLSSTANQITPLTFVLPNQRVDRLEFAEPGLWSVYEFFFSTNRKEQFAEFYKKGIRLQLQTFN